MVTVKQKKVFVYCTSGVSRAPTVIMTYLAFFKQVERYDDLQYIEDLLAMFHPGSLPNAEAVAFLLEQNQESWLNVTPNPQADLSNLSFPSPVLNFENNLAHDASRVNDTIGISSI